MVDPNNFEYQYNGGDMFGSVNNNMSVPTEDLSIIVELVTNSKSRSVLVNSTTNGTVNTKYNTNGSSFVSFINGTKDGTTGFQNYLTTNYTDIATQKVVEEALGITSIDIEFNSSYAPMVNINFVDIKGGAIFQSGAKSIYNVLFRLPYPLFELKVKGFYGKPVTYCLHMIKCNTKFNSQTGNFEITANFVGYTYAMFSDMIVGYLRAASRLPEGAEIIKNKGTITINKFMKDMSNINAEINKVLTDTSNQNRNNYALISELQNDLTDILTLTENFIADLKTPNVGDTTACDVKESFQKNIVFVADPNTEPLNSFNDTKSQKLDTDFNKELEAKITAFNLKAGDLESIKIKESIQSADVYFQTNWLLGPSGGPTNTDMIEAIEARYKNVVDVTIEENVKNIIIRLQDAQTNLSIDESYVKTYDVTEIKSELQRVNQQLSIEKQVFSKSLAEELEREITNKLKFQPNIRNIFKMFTAHVEMFLELMFKVSSKYTEQIRLREFEKFKTTTSSEKSIDRLDVKQEKINDNNMTVYPWPEFIRNDEEKYLGSPGVVPNPLNIPEVDFVEKLYDAMVQNVKEDQETQENLNGPTAWLSFSPADTVKYTENKKPYDRLPDSATYEDVARLVVLRLAGLLCFSNNYLSDDELKLFANSEADLIIEKYKDNKATIQALTQNYKTVDDYAKVKGTVENTETLVLNKGGESPAIYGYQYVTQIFTRKFNDGTTSTFGIDFLPINEGFNNIEKKYGEPDFAAIKLSDRHGIAPSIIFSSDNSKYIEFIDENNYDTGDSKSPVSTPNTFKLDALSEQIYTDDLTLNTDEHRLSKTAAAGFSIANGIYGVQEFTTVDWSSKSEYSAGVLPFYSIFYDNPLIDDGYEGFHTGLAEPRTEQKTSYDLEFSANTFGSYSLSILNGNGKLFNSNLNLYTKLTENHDDVGKNINLFNKTQDQLAFPFLNFSVSKPGAFFGLVGVIENEISLFGSRLYNNQTNVYAKAFLFLNCLPWKGLVGKTGEPVRVNIAGVPVPATVLSNVGIFKQNEIRNTFSIRSGYVQVPRLWPAFIGSLIWRYREGSAGKETIIFKDSSGKSLIPLIDDNNFPNYDEHLKAIPKLGNFLSITASDKDRFKSNFAMFFSTSGDTNYQKIDSLILNLPENVQEKFVQEYVTFITEFTNEIIPILDLKTTDSWDETWDKLNTSTTFLKGTQELKDYGLAGSYTEVPANTLVKINELYGNDKNNNELEKDYSVLSYFYDDKQNGNSLFNYNLIVEYKHNGQAENKLKDLLLSFKYIENDSISIFKDRPSAGISESNFSTYITTIIDKLSKQNAELQKTKFESAENEQIKLEIYRKLKKIYDKWVGGVGGSPRPYNDILFQCCSRGTNEPLRLPTDTKVNEKFGTNSPNQLNLIDSFRFVSRSFKDIGDDFKINPQIVTEQLLDSSDVSIYDLFSRVLTDNNFDFVALPNFINFNDENELSSVFEPIPYYVADKIAATGPSFVCVYVGQTSTKLDFKGESDYPNDGFDLTKSETYPIDFNETKQDWEDFASAFVVRYGHQNQNIFKDIRLDQSEFNETAESLDITDAISNQLSRSSQTYAGQNLYNVYSVRSYKVEVEMMGDAMIQPMMYFQLDNIPMFHGAYLITKVSHNIRPNNMITTFTGTRIKIARTPLVDANTLYSALLAGNEVGAAPAGGTISTAGESSGTVDGSRKNTKLYNKDKISKQDFDNNQKVTLDILKKQGLTREQTAGMMGNIYAESGFVPTNGGGDVTSSSWGLIAWNLKGNDIPEKYKRGDKKSDGTLYTDKEILNLNAEELFKFIGKTAESQVNSLFKVPSGGKPTVAITTMPKFLTQSKTSPTADNAAFIFAKEVERCSGCNAKEYYVGKTVLFPNKNGVKVPTKVNPSKRSEYANDFYLRFNDPNDILYWGSTITIPTNVPQTTNQNIIIGDSLATCLENILITAGSSARKISPTQGESSLWEGGKAAPWLINALKKYPVNTAVKGVVVSIGSNDGFNNSNNLTTILTELRRVFPNAKYLFVRGSYGWGGNASYLPAVPVDDINNNPLSNGTVNSDNAKVKSYYSVLNGQSNVIVLNQGVGYSATDGEAHNCSGPKKVHYPVLANEIKSYIG